MSEVKNQVREALELASKELLIAQASLAEYANILSREPYEADRAYDAHTEVAAALTAVVRSQALDELVSISQEAGLYGNPTPDVPSSEEIEAIRARHAERAKSCPPDSDYTLLGVSDAVSAFHDCAKLLAEVDYLAPNEALLRNELDRVGKDVRRALGLAHARQAELDAAREELRKEQVSHLKTRVMLTRIRQRGDGWQDISTAPKDGTQILAIVAENDDRHLANQAGRVFCIRYETFGGKFGGWGVYPGYGGAPDSNFSYWKPVPPTPPKGSEG